MYTAAMMNPTMAAPISLPATMDVLLTGIVSSVSSVLVSFSMPIEEMTMPPAIVTSIMMIMGTTIDWPLSMFATVDGETPSITRPLKTVVSLRAVGASAMLGLMPV